MNECLNHPHDACYCRERAFKNLLVMAKRAADVIAGEWNDVPSWLEDAIVEAEKVQQ